MALSLIIYDSDVVANQLWNPSIRIRFMPEARQGLGAFPAAPSVAVAEELRAEKNVGSIGWQ